MEYTSRSSSSVPSISILRVSRSACMDSEATCGLDHLFPPSSTTSSNFTHLKQNMRERLANVVKHNNMLLWKRSSKTMSPCRTLKFKCIHLDSNFKQLMLIFFPFDKIILYNDKHVVVLRPEDNIVICFL